MCDAAALAPGKGGWRRWRRPQLRGGGAASSRPCRDKGEGGKAHKTLLIVSAVQWALRWATPAVVLQTLPPHRRARYHSPAAAAAAVMKTPADIARDALDDATAGIPHRNRAEPIPSGVVGAGSDQTGAAVSGVEDSVGRQGKIPTEGRVSLLVGSVTATAICPC